MPHPAAPIPTPSDLARIAATVATRHEQLETAIGEERQAEAALLEAVVAAVRPALRALASRLAVSWGHRVDFGALPTVYAPERG